MTEIIAIPTDLTATVISPEADAAAAGRGPVDPIRTDLDQNAHSTA
ncbi:MAG: hypothetical protein Q8L66_04215 [Caulobacter sp.]|nr:hypothetical protein [Caulobacter sp.]